MSLSSLPLELLREILGWAIQVRGVKRGVRLRLVNSKISLARRTVRVPTYKQLQRFLRVKR
jgi:hypothetical protein